MNIRRFVAPDMREALNAVRRELGADALMVSSRKLENGVEVIAAIDYDDSLLSAVGDNLQTPLADTDLAIDDDYAADDDEPVDANAEEALSEYERLALATTQQPAFAPRQEATEQVSPAEPKVDEATLRMGEEIKDLRRMLETQLASFAWNDLNRRAPARARLLRELHKLGVDTTLAAELANDIPTTVDSREGLRLLMRRLAERLPLVEWDIAERGGIFAVVGPTGVGKTTTIAKIAARFVLRHGVEELGLVSTDAYRIGARQQLFNFARILRAPMHIADSASELTRVLDGFSRKKLVLIDTAGMSQRDVRLANQFATLKPEGHRVQTVLALSAGADRRCLTEALKVFEKAAPEALIVTKLDEAAVLGPVMSLAIASGLPLAYLSNGQRVPEDLHLAAPRRYWLLHNAVKLTLDPALLPSETELAQSFGQMELAANA
jgi:flagellar biosynthesis protein FlhF